MMKNTHTRSALPPLTLAALLVTLLAAAPAAHAVDGVVLIDQSRALAGNVTPGDTAGFPITISQPGSYRLDGPIAADEVGLRIHVGLEHPEDLIADLGAGLQRLSAHPG